MIVLIAATATTRERLSRLLSEEPAAAAEVDGGRLEEVGGEGWRLWSARVRTRQKQDERREVSRVV